MADYTVRSAPERLITVSDEISRDVSTIKATFSDIQAKVNQTNTFWTGDAAELHRALFDEQIPQMETIVERFSSQAEKLRTIAGNYMGAREQVKETVEALPDDVLI